MGGEIEKLQELLRTDPSNFQARRELSVLLADNGFNEEALNNLKYLKKYFPDDADIAYNMGIIYEKLKDYKNAKKAYKKAISLSPQPDFYYNLGEVLVNLEEWDEGIDIFRKVLNFDPNDENCYFNLGVCYLNKDDKNLALNNFQKAVELNPKDLYAYFYLGNIYQEQGLTNFAEDCYNKVLEISPDYSWAYFNIASIAYLNGDLEKAKSNLLLTTEYNNQDIEAYKLLTKIFIKDNDIESILTILHTRLEKDENGDLYYILAQVYKRIGNTENYIKYLDSALKNSLTLTYNLELVKKEFDNIKLSAGLESPAEIEEYTEDSDIIEDKNESENEEDESDDFSYDDVVETEYNDDDNFEDDENFEDEVFKNNNDG